MVLSRGSDTQQEVQDRVHSSENEKEGEFGNDQGGPRGFNCQDVATDEKGACGRDGAYKTLESSTGFKGPSV